MENFQTVDNFHVIYFANLADIPIFAPTFISKAKTSTAKRTSTIKSISKSEKLNLTISESGKANLHLR